MGHPQEHDRESEAPGIYHACLFEHFEHLGSSLGGIDGLVGGGLDYIVDVSALLGGFGRGFGGFADDSEHCAFYGIWHSPVCHLGCEGQSVSEVASIDCIGVSHCVAQPSEKLGHDESAVATGSEECGAGHRGRGRRHVFGRGGLHVGCDAAHGEHHVGAGVAVGHREDVEGVELVLISGNCGESGAREIAQEVAVSSRDLRRHQRTLCLLKVAWRDGVDTASLTCELTAMLS